MLPGGKKENSMGHKVAACPAGMPFSGQCLCVTWKRHSWEWTLCARPAARGQGFSFPCPLGSGPRATNHMTLWGILLSQLPPPGASQMLAWGSSCEELPEGSAYFPRMCTSAMPLNWTLPWMHFFPASFHSSSLAWRIPWREEPLGYSPWGRKESDTTERLHFTSFCYLSL